MHRPPTTTERGIPPSTQTGYAGSQQQTIDQTNTLSKASAKGYAVDDSGGAITISAPGMPPQRFNSWADASKALSMLPEIPQSSSAPAGEETPYNADARRGHSQSPRGELHYNCRCASVVAASSLSSQMTRRCRKAPMSAAL
jgi:hypothetical protein